MGQHKVPRIERHCPHRVLWRIVSTAIPIRETISADRREWKSLKDRNVFRVEIPNGVGVDTRCGLQRLIVVMKVKSSDNALQHPFMWRSTQGKRFDMAEKNTGPCS